MNLFFISVFIILFLFIIAASIIFFQARRLDVTKYEIADKNLPQEFDGLTIAQISDFHNTQSAVIRTKLVDALKNTRPDIIVITGDFVDYYRTDETVSINFLREIISVAPIYYVTGNHEARVSSYPQFSQRLQCMGVTLLDNKKIKLKKDDSCVKLLGLEYPYFYYIEDKNTCRQKFSDNLSELSCNDNAYKILLSHRPERFEMYSKYGINLVFSGHAHGGQFVIPGVGGLFAPGQGFLPKYSIGLYEKHDTKMIVNRGIGNSSFPLRINNSPELVVARLKSDQ